MKTNGTRSLLIVSILLIISLLITLTGFSQPDYDFRNSTLISGTNKEVGSSYRFPNVKPGFDAIVTIVDITGGITLDELDGGSGFVEALQPVLRVPAFADGYVELKIDFVEAGTFTPALMLEVPATPIDVDGKQYASGNVYENDRIELSAGSYVDYNLLGGELSITFNSGWVYGTNIAAIDYPGVDTLAKQAMFTVVNANISSFMLRTGANNQSDAVVQRLRSIYFKKFKYLNSFLAKSPLESFTGNEKNNKVSLQWKLSAENAIARVVVEKATTANQFYALGTVGADAEKNGNYDFTDNASIQGNTFYRLKMEGANGAVQYSNVLVFRDKSSSAQAFQIYPTSIQQTATVNVMAERAGNASFQVVDFSGRIIMQKNISVNEGNNNIVVNNLDNLNRGNYIAVIKLDNRVYNQKIVKQ